MRAFSLLNARPLPQKIVFASVLLIAALAIAAALYRAFSLPMVPLCARTTPNESVRIIDYLDTTATVYAFDETGSIVVPGKDADRLREALAASGICRHAKPSGTTETGYSVSRRVFQLLLLGMLAAVLWLFASLGLRIRSDLRRRETVAAAARPEPVKTASGAIPDISQEKTALRLKLLQREHPQVVTVFLLSAETEKSAGLLEAMPAAQRRAVWKRMARWKGCDEALCRQVVSMFEAKVRRWEHSEGFEKIKAIFSKLSPALQREILELFSDNETAQILRTELAELMRSGKL